MMEGFADLHNHQFAYLGFGGRAFHGHAFGDLRQALRHCDFGPGVAGPMTEIHGPGGAGDFVGNLIRAMEYGAGFWGALGHKVGGYPEFDGWPRWDSVTHQAVHEDWLYRAVQGGLRLIVMMAVNSEYMCAKVNTDLSCNDMEAVDRQLAAARQMEAYIDSKSGGPGKGWYRIVYTPDEARAVIMAGKLAVVLGIEVDYLFNCHREADLTEDLLRAQLDRYYAAGVRHLFPIHFDNNGFGATAFQNGLQFGIDVENPVNNEPGLPLNPFPVFAAYTVVTEDAQPFGYEYRTGRRATQGLTELGKTLIREMIARGMIIDIDHMSARAKAEVLDICEAARYPVVAGHVGFVEISRGDKAHEGQLLAAEVERIRRLGGMVAVIVRQGTKDQIKTWRGPGQTVVDHSCSNSSETWVQAYLHAVAKMQGQPVAFGTDFNGLIPPTGPRFGPDACLREGGTSAHATRVAYPFIAASTGERLDHSVVGEMTF
jgi:microsomal dipeptidase-like Zn-dependent dipeptidase